MTKHVLAATETTPSSASVVEGPNIRADVNGVVRLLQPDGRWAALEWLAVDGVAHLVPSLDDITDEAPPIRGAVQAEFIRSKLAAMAELDRPRGEEFGELHDDLVGTEYQASLDPHMEGFGREELWEAVWARWRAKNAVAIAVRNMVDAVTVDALPEEKPGKRRPKKTEKEDLVLVIPPEVPKATEALTADMDRHWPVVLAKLGPLDGEPAELTRRAKDALLALGGGVNDALAAAGAENAGRLKPTAWPDPVPLARLVAQALWTAETGLRLDLAKRHGPGLAPFAVTAVAAIAARGTQTELGLDKERERAEFVQGRSGKTVAALVRIAEIDPSVVDRSRLGTLDAHRFMRWVISETHRQKYQLGLACPNEIVLMGGYGALAERLGIEGGGKRVADLRSIVETFSHTSVYVGSILTSLLSREYDDARRNKPSKLKLTASGPFAPGFFSEWADRLPRGPKQIVPVPLASMLPPLVGRERDQAAQAQLQQLTLREIRARADEYVTLGGALSIDDRIWADLSNEAELPRTLLPEVLDAWHRGNERPAFLVREGGIYRLGPAYWREHRTIWEGGRRVVKGREDECSRRRRAPRHKPQRNPP